LKVYHVLLADGTTGALCSSEGEDAISSRIIRINLSLLGARVTVKTADENGVPMEVDGIVAEVLDVRDPWN